MGKQKAPAPPNPVETSKAQTGTSVATALANTSLQNVNRVGADGSTLTYNQTGSSAFKDPYTGVTYQLPQYTATERLSAPAQAIYDTRQGAEQNLATAARNQSGNVVNSMSQPWNPNLEAYSNAAFMSDMGALGDGSQPFQANLGEMGGATSAPFTADLGDLSSVGNTPFQADLGALSSVGNTPFNADTSAIESRLFDLGSRTLNPQFDRQRSDLETRLSNQGIKLGSAAYDRAMNEQGNTQNQAYNDLALRGRGQAFDELQGIEATRQGQRAARFGELQGIEATRQGQRAARFGESLATNQQREAQRSSRFGESLATSQQNEALRNALFGRQLSTNQQQQSQRQQSLQEQQAIRNQPLNELSALLSGSQVAMPSYGVNTPAGIPTTDNAGLINANYGQQMQNWQQDRQSWDSTVGGLFGLGSAAIMSDRRTKTDIEKVGKTDDGQKIYSYRYKSGGPIQMGLMAQEVEKKRPDAVVRKGGIRFVDYGKALK